VEEEVDDADKEAVEEEVTHDEEVLAIDEEDDDAKDVEADDVADDSADAVAVVVAFLYLLRLVDIDGDVEILFGSIFNFFNCFNILDSFMSIMLI
jgi:hypothetical protein